MTAVDVMVKRKDAGIRQDALAAELGWNRETIIDIERGRVKVTEQTVSQISNAIDSLVQASKHREEVIA